MKLPLTIHLSDLFAIQNAERIDSVTGSLSSDREAPIYDKYVLSEFTRLWLDKEAHSISNFPF